MLDHCPRHPTHVPVCGECYRIRMNSVRELAEAKWGTPGAPKSVPVVVPAPRPAPAVARKSDPETAHQGVARISAGTSENRRKIMALEFPAHGLNYREISVAASIFPTTCSRVLTTMYRQGDLRRVSKDSGGFRYAPEKAFTVAPVNVEVEEL